MKKIFTLLSLMFVMSMMSLQCWATARVEFGGYTLNAGDTRTSSSPYITSGSISYSADGTTITLDNLTEASSYSGLKVTDCSVKIILKGANTTGNWYFDANGASYTHSIESEDGTGSLTISSSTDAMWFACASLTIKNCSVDVTGKHGFYGWNNGTGTGLTLTIDNATVKAQGTNGSIAGRIEGLTLNNCCFTAPSGAYYDSTKCFVTTDGTNATTEQVVIQPAPSVTLNSAGYATYSSAGNVNIATDGVKAYKASVSGDVITLTELSGYIPAGTGVLLYGTASATVTFNGAANGTAANVDGNVLMPTTLAGGTLATKAADVWALSAADGNAFKKYTGAFIANRAYMPESVKSFSGAKGMTIVFADGETTGVANVDANANLNNSAAFNLAGQRVNANQKGIIIKNGKKYIVK